MAHTEGHRMGSSHRAESVRENITTFGGRTIGNRSGRNLRFETLERRTMLDGTLTVVISGHDLKITGDQSANSFSLFQPNGDGTDYTVTGDNNTQVVFGGQTFASGVQVPITGSGTAVTQTSSSNYWEAPTSLIRKAHIIAEI